MAKKNQSQIVEQPINNMVVISDTHLGCQYGLCPPKVRMDGGGYYARSAMQATVWTWWREFWDEFVPTATKGEPYIVVHNGDIIDGRHHNSTSQLTQSKSDQRRLAERALGEVYDKCGGSMYAVRGTPVHSGEGGEDEESISEHLNLIPGATGEYARNELWVRVGGALCHLMHHIGTSSRLSYETSALMGEMGEEFQIASRFRDVPPDVIIRSHRHTNIEVSGPSINYRWYAAITPGWQLKTPFAWRIAGARMVPPQFGGLVVRQGSQHHFVETYVRMLSRGKIERPTYKGGSR